MSEDVLTPETADFRARVFVNGLVDEIKHDERTGKKVVHAGHWAPRFEEHPWVQSAEEEGWGRDLRGAVIAKVKLRIMRREAYHDIDQLMPSKELIDFWREKAAREREAMAWRDENFDKDAGKRIDAKPLAAATREVFRQMQRNSPNRFHLKPLAELSQISRRMSGERE